MDDRLSRDDWLRAARRALLTRGPEAVRVEPLARDLGVTKGSFYWHFADRANLLEALLVEWEQETRLLSDALHTARPRAELPAIIAELDRRNLASERGESPSDAAIFAWAASDPEVARRANRVEAERMRLFRKLTGKKALADLFFYAYHGFLLRRRRVPSAAGDFESIARLALRAFGPKKKKSRRRIGVHGVALAAIVCGMGSLQGCTQFRIVRWRDPSAHEPLKIFPQRVVHRADTAFRFAIGPQRSDLDTVSVRDIDFRLRPFSQYVQNRHIKAFVVIRNDTIVYERYVGGYTDSTRSSSFSVAKSITSALLGIALESGAIRSLDDSVARYIPEIASKPAFRGITVRHLVAMQSGFAYSRTNGRLWHDFRSSDAHFYYTTNIRSSLAGQRREDPPGARWAYKDSDTQLLAWVLERATGKTLAAQLEESVWRRIGTEHDASWDLDHGNGSENAASGLNATARDLARFGRLYLNDGKWNGTQILPHDWVVSSRTLDSSRVEPEVPTWWLMQHQQLWWIPMQNWAADQDFFADGSRGQRIYVNRRLRTIIVQLADESAQDFPFRKIAHYLAGEPYTYPRVIANQLYAAIAGGASVDSVRSLYSALLKRGAADPGAYSNSRAMLLALSRRLESERKSAMAALVKSLSEMTPPNGRAGAP
jgi:CubicO group peptidase (beta-lactamase class C family)/AcrR family transcriptional regulator